MNNEELIWNKLREAGLSEAGTAGIMGNLYAESALRPNNLQNSYERSLGKTDESYTKEVDEGLYDNFIRDSAGYGLAQWTYWSRKKGLLLYAKETNRSIGNLEMQVEFLIKELKTEYKTIWDSLTSMNNVREASNLILFKYERPAVQDIGVQNQRYNYSARYYNKFNSGVSEIKKENYLYFDGKKYKIVEAD